MNLSYSGFAVLINHRVKVKEEKRLNKYPEVSRVLKKLWNMKLTVISNIDGALGIILKCWEKSIAEMEPPRPQLY